MYIVKNIARYLSLLLAMNFSMMAGVFSAEPGMNVNFLPAESKAVEKNIDHNYSSYTQYETRFLPGFNPCPSFTNNPAGLSMTDCQGFSDAQTQRSPELFRPTPSTIVDNDIKPRANILQIKFDRRIRSK